MIRKFENFISKKPEIDENTISIRYNKNELFYINIYFDDSGRVNFIDNPWSIALPIGMDLRSI